MMMMTTMMMMMMLWVRIPVYHAQFSVAYSFLCPHFWARCLMLVTVNYGYWLPVIEQLNAEWLSDLWNYTYVFTFFSKSKKTWLFTFFWIVEHVFWNADTGVHQCSSRVRVNVNSALHLLRWTHWRLDEKQQTENECRQDTAGVAQDTSTACQGDQHRAPTALCPHHAVVRSARPRRQHRWFDSQLTMVDHVAALRRSYLFQLYAS